jgi:hypothetical protein
MEINNNITSFSDGNYSHFETDASKDVILTKTINSSLITHGICLT